MMIFDDIVMRTNMFVNVPFYLSSHYRISFCMHFMLHHLLERTATKGGISVLRKRIAKETPC